MPIAVDGLADWVLTEISNDDDFSLKPTPSNYFLYLMLDII